MEEAVNTKRMCFKLWKAVGSRATYYNIAKQASKYTVHQTKGEDENVARQKIDPRSANIYRLAKQMQRDNHDVIGERQEKA